MRWALILLGAVLATMACGQVAPIPGAPEWPAGQVPGGSQPGPAPTAQGYPQGPAQGPAEPDGSDPGVARISLTQGDVSVRRGDSGETVAAAVNAPLVVADHLLTAAGARAEAQFDYSNMVRLAPGTDLRFSQLDDHRYQVQIGAGTIMFRVVRPNGAETEIDTPSVAVRPVKEGSYRITVRPDGSSEITVRSGQADIYTPKGSEELHAGKTMLARGDASDPEFQVTGAIPLDDFDRWNQERDRNLERLQAEAYQHVNPDVYGAEDMDPYGRWTVDPTYGQVWAPSVGVDWAPYRNGRWVWEDYYGWTWVSYDPWGWAPYHYGRWFVGSAGWCWWPGPRFGHAYWSPALVGFFGFGAGGVNIGFGFGNVGWVPLAPYEPFHRWWGGGRWGYGYGGFYDRTVVVNNVNIRGTFRNARYLNGITAMRSSEFGRAGIGRGNMVRVGAGDLERAGSVRGMLPLAPSRASLAASNRSVNPARFPRTISQQRFFSHRAAPQVNHVSFDQQRQGMERLSHSAFNQPREGGAASGFGRGTPAGSPAGHGWRRAEEPASRAATPSGGNRGGWQRFNGSMEGTRGSSPRGIMGTRTERGSESVGRPSNRGFGSTGAERGFGRPGNEGGRSIERRGEYSAPQRSNGGRSFERGGGYAAPQRNYGSRSLERGGGYAEPRGGSSPVRINPPIVRERGGSFSRPERSSGGAHPSFGRPEMRSPGGGGGGGYHGGGASHGGGGHGGHGGRR